MATGITLDSDEVRRRLRELTDREIPRFGAEVLNKVAFEVRDELAEEADRAFDFAGPSTQKFISRGWRFDKATPAKLEATIFPLRTTGEIIEDHVRGDTIRADGERLQFGGKLAVPIAAKRGRRGRVPKRLMPGTVTAPGGKGFVARDGRFILQRYGRGGRSIRVLYALIDSAQLEPRFDFVGSVTRRARAEIGSKARRVFEKIRSRRG